MDAGVEPPWKVSRRVVGGCARFMSRITLKQDKPATLTFMDEKYL
jgi:hypothetical protein